MIRAFAQTPIGLIGPRAMTDIARRHGIDYVEPAIVGNAVLATADGAFEPNPVFAGERFPSFAILLPKDDVRVADPAFDFGAVEAYLHGVFAALAQIAEPGAKIVFGSGVARSIPDGVPRAAAERRFVDSLLAARDAAAAHDLRVMLEPLRSSETNLINDIDEGVAFLDRYGVDDVLIVADAFHIEEQGAPLSAVSRHIDRIGHAHLAGPGRKSLGVAGGIWRDYVETLREAGYDGSISIECHWGDDPEAEIADSIAALRAVV